MNKTNYHTHTERCHHATGSDEAYVLSAIKSGFTELGFADHCPWPFDHHYVSKIRMTPDQLENYVTSLHSLKLKYANQMSIKIGLECEYYEEYIPWLKTMVEQYKLDYLIFGNHYSGNEQYECDYGKSHPTKQSLLAYLKTAITAMESGLFAYFAHPDIFIRAYGTFDDVCEQVSRQICEKAKELDLLLEYNISSYIYEPDREAYLFPNPNFWKIAGEVGCRCIIGYDAHIDHALENDNARTKALIELQHLNLTVVDTIPFKTQN
ncbi:MAG: histidinol-phosphatase [Turicibacter sp.]